ncbi:MAG: hypothetical protein WDW38_009908 [Sanguina aurantia]
MMDQQLKLANLRAKLLGSTGGRETKLNFEALTDLIDEAKFNRASVMDASRCAQELAALLAMPAAALRAVTIRQITEYGRGAELPDWHGSEPRHTMVWYQCMSRLRLVEFGAGDVIVQEGARDSQAYWLLTGEAMISSNSDPDAVSKLEVWDMFGEAALQQAPYTCTVMAVGKVQCATISEASYKAALATLATETPESLQRKHLMMHDRGTRSAGHLDDMAGMLQAVEMFQHMEPLLCREVCNLVEYMSVPEGTVLFEEGDRVDFCYIVLSGKVVFSKISENGRRREDIGSKAAGEHFGSLTTLASPDRKRPFSARSAAATTELALISRLGYNRVVKQQLKSTIDVRVKLLQQLHVFKDTVVELQKAASCCQDMVFSPGVTIVDPTQPGNAHVYFILEGECKLMWVADGAEQRPPSLEDLTKDSASHPSPAMVALAMHGFVAHPPTKGPAAHTSSPAQHAAPGDMMNGFLLHNSNSVFTIVSVTAVKLMCLEAVAIESTFGLDACEALKALALSQTQGYLERVAHVLSVRQSMLANITSGKQELPEAQMGPFLDHYVPQFTPTTGIHLSRLPYMSQLRDIPLTTVLGGSMTSLADDPPSPPHRQHPLASAAGTAPPGSGGLVTSSDFLVSGRKLSVAMTPKQRHEADAGRQTAMLRQRRGLGAPPPLAPFAGSISLSVLDSSTAVRCRRVSPHAPTTAAFSLGVAHVGYRRVGGSCSAGSDGGGGGSRRRCRPAAVRQGRCWGAGASRRASGAGGSDHHAFSSPAATEEGWSEGRVATRDRMPSHLGTGDSGLLSEDPSFADGDLPRHSFATRIMRLPTPQEGLEVSGGAGALDAGLPVDRGGGAGHPGSQQPGGMCARDSRVEPDSVFQGSTGPAGVVCEEGTGEGRGGRECSGEGPAVDGRMDSSGGQVGRMSADRDGAREGEAQEQRRVQQQLQQRQQRLQQDLNSLLRTSGGEHHDRHGEGHDSVQHATEHAPPEPGREAHSSQPRRRVSYSEAVTPMATQDSGASLRRRSLSSVSESSAAHDETGGEDMDGGTDAYGGSHSRCSDATTEADGLVAHLGYGTRALDSRAVRANSAASVADEHGHAAALGAVVLGPRLSSAADAHLRTDESCASSQTLAEDSSRWNSSGHRRAGVRGLLPPHASPFRPLAGQALTEPLGEDIISATSEFQWSTLASGSEPTLPSHVHHTPQHYPTRAGEVSAAELIANTEVSNILAQAAALDPPSCAASPAQPSPPPPPPHTQRCAEGNPLDDQHRQHQAQRCGKHEGLGEAARDPKPRAVHRSCIVDGPPRWRCVVGGRPGVHVEREQLGQPEHGQRSGPLTRAPTAAAAAVTGHVITHPPTLHPAASLHLVDGGSTAQLAADRSTTLMSDTLLADAGIGSSAVPTATAPASATSLPRLDRVHLPPSPAPAPPPSSRPDSRNVVILPQMMNQYQSLVAGQTPHGGFTHAIALHQAAPTTTTTLRSIMSGGTATTRPFFTALQHFHQVQAGYSGHHGLVGALAEATATASLPLCVTEARKVEADLAAAAFLRSRAAIPLSEAGMFSMRELSGVEKLGVGSVVTRGSGGLVGSAGGRRFQGHIEPSVGLKEGPASPLEVDANAPHPGGHRLRDPTLQDLTYILGRWGQRWASERDVIQAKHKEAKLHLGKSTALTVPDLLASIQYNSQVLGNKPARSLLDVDFDAEAHEAAAVAVTEQAQLVVVADEILRFSRRLESLPMYGQPAS